MAIETELQAQVDAQLMEQGAFAPLDLLFNSGRLFYSDYEAWRRREIDLLDDVLMGDRAKILAEMERAVAYARSIGLVEQPQPEEKRDGAPRKGCQRLTPPSSSGQLDLVCS